MVTLEGLDGVGKTTQIERLKSWLQDKVEVLAVREPGGTALGEALRNVILHRVEAGSALAEFLVFAAARAELMHQIVLPALTRGAVVLMDRFIDSSVAYQAFGRDLSVEAVMTVNRIATQGRTPDLTVWLRGQPYETGSPDRLEQRDLAYFARVEAGYEWLVRQDPERWLVVDCRQPADVVFDTLVRAVARRMTS
nr:dTMP kinase [Sulfobacillus harzensis]